MATCAVSPMRRRTSVPCVATSKPATVGRSAVCGRERREDPHRSGHAGSVGAEDRRHGAGGHRDIDTMEGGLLSKAFDQALASIAYVGEDIMLRTFPHRPKLAIDVNFM